MCSFANTKGREANHSIMTTSDRLPRDAGGKVWPFTRKVIVLAAVAMLFISATTMAERSAPSEARQVADNWLTLMVSLRGGWAGTIAPQVEYTHEIYKADTLVGYGFDIQPSGWIIVPLLKELSPVKAYSEIGHLDLEEELGCVAVVRDVLANRIMVYIEAYGSIDAAQPVTGEVLYDRSQRLKWDDYAADKRSFTEYMERKALLSIDEVGPLLTTHWHQNHPFNMYCPTSPCGQCVVGCVATTWAQIMKYWEWPEQGVGSHDYLWQGDYTCSGHTPEPDVLFADFSDPYDWDNMPDRCDGMADCSAIEKAAVAELCYEVGVSVNMFYGTGGSSSNTSNGRWSLPQYFRYKSIDQGWMQYRSRMGYTPETWFDIVRSEINANRPIAYGIVSHAIVCDGYRTIDEVNEYHMNYGWANSNDMWYTVDLLWCPWDGCHYLMEEMITRIKPDMAIVIDADQKVGWVPFEVQFTGYSDEIIDIWVWDFGDGDSSSVQSPTHTYTEPGLYDVSLRIIGSGGHYYQEKTGYILALADSLCARGGDGDPGDTVDVVVHCRNTQALSQIKVPVEYGGPGMSLDLLSYSIAGCRTEYFQTADFAHFDISNKRVTFRLEAGGQPPLPPGEGDVLKLKFRIPFSAVPTQNACVELDGYEQFLPTFTGDLAQYPAATMSCDVTVLGVCCDGIRGNVDYDPEDLVDAVDIVYLADYLFGNRGGPRPPCWDEGNVNGDSEDYVNIIDLTVLVSYVYASGNRIEPSPCPAP